MIDHHDRRVHSHSDAKQLASQLVEGGVQLMKINNFRELQEALNPKIYYNVPLSEP